MGIELIVRSDGFCEYYSMKWILWRSTWPFESHDNYTTKQLEECARTLISEVMTRAHCKVPQDFTSTNEAEFVQLLSGKTNLEKLCEFVLQQPETKLNTHFADFVHLTNCSLAEHSRKLCILRQLLNDKAYASHKVSELLEFLPDDDDVDDFEHPLRFGFKILCHAEDGCTAELSY